MNPLQKDVFYQASFDRNWNPVCVCVCVRVCGEGGGEGGEGERCLFNTGDTGNSPLGRPNHITGGGETAKNNR